MSFIQLDNDVMNYTALSLRARVLFGIIADKSKLADGCCTMVRKGLAKILGCNEKSVDRALKELLERNIIEKRVVNYAEHLSFNNYRPTEKTEWRIQIQDLDRIGEGIQKTDTPIQNGTGTDTDGEGLSNFDQGGIPKTDRGVDKNDHHSQTKYSQTKYSQKNLHDISHPSEIPPDPSSLPAANAVDQKNSKTAIIPVFSQPPPKSRKNRKIELSPEQLRLFHAAKACFETSEIAKTIIYQDQETTAQEMRHLKTLILRCSNMVPDITADFLKDVLEHFRIMVNGKLKGKAVFTPRALITPWIWELVIDSLPENNITPGLQKSVKELFK